MIDVFIYWLGAATASTALLWGLTEGGFWVAGRILKSVGLWPDFWRVLRRVYRERAEVREDVGNG